MKHNPFVTRVCAKCGKEFIPAPMHIYKKSFRNRMSWYCGWNCYPKDLSKGGVKKVRYAERILSFRAENDLTQRQLADILGVNVNMVARYESEIAMPTKKNAVMFEKKMKEWSEKNGNVQMR